MAKLLSSKEIIKVLLDNEFYFISQKGSHRKYRKLDRVVIVPYPKKEIPIGTLKSIIRQSGLNKNLFMKSRI